MLTIEPLPHAAVAVTDLDAAKHFYSDVIGLEEIARPPFSFAGAWYRAGNRNIHLIVVPPEAINPRRKLDMADTHLAFRVKRFSDALAHLNQKGFTTDNENPLRAIRVTIGGPAGFPQVHIMDPDHNIIEINAETDS